MLTVPALARFHNLRHAFFSREGGVSEGLYASLNCGPGSRDNAAAVAENRRRAMTRLGLGPDALVTVNQVHGTDVVTITDPRPAGRRDRPRADALVTAQPGVALGILTADCAPVLFADAEAGVIGAAHAGWRGALDGVLDATVRHMTDIGAAPGRIIAAIGPCIGQASYEVGPEFIARFVAAQSTNGAFFVPSSRAGHHYFDLAGYVADRLSRLGLARVFNTGADTCADPARFFSYRRSVLTGEPDYGRLLAAIALAP
ncbi:MAG: peptidoglycan editing factor PgeF [Alphaproteobacteria bacterium]